MTRSHPAHGAEQRRRLQAENQPATGGLRDCTKPLEIVSTLQGVEGAMIEIHGFADHRLIRPLLEHFHGSVEVIAAGVTVRRLGALDQENRGLKITIDAIGQDAYKLVGVLRRNLDVAASRRNVRIDPGEPQQDTGFVDIIIA